MMEWPLYTKKDGWRPGLCAGCGSRLGRNHMRGICAICTAPEENKLLIGATVGDRVRFEEEVQAYTIQARSSRYLVFTKPFNVRRTVPLHGGGPRRAGAWHREPDLWDGR